MKKNLNLIVLLGSLFFAALVFAFMALPAIALGGLDSSFYNILEDGGPLATFILFLVGFLAGACACVIKVLNMKFKYGHFVAFCGALLLLVAGILFFCTASFYDFVSLGAGAVLCAICAILAALGLCFYGALEGKFIKL